MLTDRSCLAQQQKPQITRSMDRSSTEATISEGLLLEAPPTYVDFQGDDGLELAISAYRSSRFDYTIMFWFRSARSYEELMQEGIMQIGRPYYLF